MTLRRSIAVLALCMVAVGCNGKKVSSVPNITVDRSRKLSVLAASEAGRISDADARLTRQLNIADQVLQRYGADDALLVLDEATKTLHEVGPALDGYARISGWVSISQLARQSAGTASAEVATKEAQAALEALPEPGERCQYVLGVAEEISHLQGDAQAIALLTRGGEWARGINDPTDRRAARLAFVNLNAFDNGVASLRGEDDPAWSSDTMLALASREVPSSMERPVAANEGREESGFAHAMGIMPAPTAAPAKPQRSNSDATYGKQLGYEQVFRGASRSRR